MFDEQIENDDQELQEIAEEPFDEEDEDSENEITQEADPQEQTKRERAQQKDEIRHLRTQLMTIR